MKNKVFVTGGGGFIGSHLIERLVNDGYSVKTIVPYNIDNSWGWLDFVEKKIKKDVEVILGDVCDQNLIHRETKKVNIILHLAALISIPYSYKSPRSYIDTNILGTYNLLEAAKLNNVDFFVNTSTSEVYGSAQYAPIDEKHPLNAQSPYAASKIAADQLTLSYYRSFGLPSMILRPFNTFGPRQSLRAAIPTMIVQSLENEKYIKLGNLNATRDFTYVTDTVQGYIKAIKYKSSCSGETINLGTGKDFSIRDIFNIVKKTLKKPQLKVISDIQRIRPKKSEVNRLISKNSKAKKLIKWAPEYSGKKGFEKGINEITLWFKQNKNKFNSKIYNL